MSELSLEIQLPSSFSGERKQRVSTRKRKQQQQPQPAEQTAAVNPFIPAPIVHASNYVRPKYRRTLQPRVPLQPAAEPVAVTATATAASPMVQTADLEQLRTLQSNQAFEAAVSTAASAAVTELQEQQQQQQQQMLPLQQTQQVMYTKQLRQIGYLKEERKLKILIPSEDDKHRWKRQLEEWLHTDLVQMRKELIDCNIIKHGSNARDITIRTLYMAMKRVGVVRNKNLGTQWHNYHRKFGADDSEGAIAAAAHLPYMHSSTRTRNSSHQTLTPSVMVPQVEVLTEA